MRVLLLTTRSVEQQRHRGEWSGVQAEDEGRGQRQRQGSGEARVQAGLCEWRVAEGQQLAKQATVVEADEADSASLVEQRSSETARRVTGAAGVEGGSLLLKEARLRTKAGQTSQIV